MDNKNESLLNSKPDIAYNKRLYGINSSEKRKKHSRTEINFRKIINTLILNINGEKPLIIYQKKSPNKNIKIEIKQNNYMSDGGIKKKNKKYFNLISNYSSKKEITNKTIKEKDVSSNIKNKRFKSFSFSKNKKVKKNNFIENEIKEENLIRNKTKGNFRYNLFLKKQKKEILKQKNNIINVEKTKEREINNKNILINNLLNENNFNTKINFRNFYSWVKN